jgi:hypothetical protein
MNEFVRVCDCDAGAIRFATERSERSLLDIYNITRYSDLLAYDRFPSCKASASLRVMPVSVT